MGCTSSLLQIGVRKKTMIIPEVVVFVPTMQIPVQSELHKGLKGLIPKDIIDRLTHFRNRVILLSDDTDVSAIPDIKQALEEYLPVLRGLTKKEYGIQEAVQFKWRTLDDRRQETCVLNSWYEVLSVVYMLAVLTLVEANLLLVPKQYTGSSDRIVSTDCQRDAVDLLLKASGYLEYCVKSVFPQLSSEIKNKLHKDMQEGALESLSLQALGQYTQGTELQLGLAIENQKATLSVKRRLACEQLTFLTQVEDIVADINGYMPKNFFVHIEIYQSHTISQAHHSLSESKMCESDAGKQALFIKYKFLESKAAAYFYHGLIVDKGNEPSSHTDALCCLVAAEELLLQSKKACLSFCLASPVTRSPPLWGAMKHLQKKIPDTVAKKSQLYSYLLDQEKGLQQPPELPEFQLSLRPDDYELPDIDTAWSREKWEIIGQPLREHLEDPEDVIEDES